MGAPQGNDFNLKWRTPEERKAACDRLCKHLAMGCSVYSWPEASKKTIDTYRLNYSDDFTSDKIENAEREARRNLELMGLQAIAGNIKFFKERTYALVMGNKYNYREKSDVTTDDEKVSQIHIYVPEKRKAEGN